MVFQLFGLRRLAQADQVAAARAEVLELTVSVVQAEVVAAEATESEKATTRTLEERAVFGVVIPQAEQLTVAQQQAQDHKVLIDYSGVVTAVEGVAVKTQE